MHSKDCVFSNILYILKIHSFFQAYIHSLTKYLLSDYYVSLFSMLAIQWLKKADKFSAIMEKTGNKQVGKKIHKEAKYYAAALNTMRKR